MDKSLVAHDDAGLRVVHVIAGLGQGGAETVLYRLLTAPTQQGRHYVVSLGGLGPIGAKLQAHGIEVYPLGMGSMKDIPRALWTLRRLLHTLQPTIVQTWMYHADFLGGIAARLAAVPAVCWGIRNSGADLQLSSPRTWRLARLCARLSRRVPDVIVACAHEARERHIQWGYDSERMVVIPNGYDFSQWQLDPSVRQSVRSQWGVDDSVCIIGNVARWNPLKDHQNLIAALAQLDSNDSHWRAVLVGDGLEESNVALMQCIQQYRLQDKVILLGGRSDVPRLMQAMDVHVLASRAEGFPNVVAEAMASGLINVVTDVGDAARIVGDTGLVVPPRDPVALARAIGTALATYRMPSAHTLQKQAQQRVQSLFSLDAMVANWQAVWQQAQIEAKQRRPGRRFKSMTAVSATGRPQRLLMVVNNPDFFLSHRLPVAQAARQAGYEVHIATMDGPGVASIRTLGFSHHGLPLSRSGRHPLQEAQSIWALWRLFRRLRPDLVHAVTIKPVLYGGLVARFARVPAFVAAISGLGYVFTEGSRRGRVLRFMVSRLYRSALAHPNSRVIFQNTADRDTLVGLRALRPGQEAFIPGSGVDLDAFAALPEPAGPVVVLCVSRLLADKGIREYIEAARLSKQRQEGLIWRLVGSPDPGNPASLPADEIEAWHKQGVIEWLGERTDIAHLYSQAHIAVLASYREGLPKSLVEAAACGRAVVTTDVPGCRDAILPGVSGLVVPPRDASALADAIHRLASDPQLRQKMGAAGRALAERSFDVSKIAKAHLLVYKSVLPPSKTDVAAS